MEAGGRESVTPCWVRPQSYQRVWRDVFGDVDRTALRDVMRALDRIQPAGLEGDGGAVGIDERVVQVVGDRAEDDQDHGRHRSHRTLPEPGHEGLPAVR